MYLAGDATRDIDDEILLAEQLSRLVKLPVDVCVLNGAPPTALFHVFRWKLPVGAFIEECYRKRFGGHPQDHQRMETEPRPREPWPAGAQAPGVSDDPIPLPPRLTRTASSWRGDQERTIEDEDDIPF